MPKNSSPKKPQSQPMSLRPKEGVRAKMEQIAEKNGISVTDVAHFCLAAGLGIVEEKLGEIHKQAA
jgi:hypothetical protein